MQINRSLQRYVQAPSVEYILKWNEFKTSKISTVIESEEQAS